MRYLIACVVVGLFACADARVPDRREGPTFSDGGADKQWSEPSECTDKLRLIRTPPAILVVMDISSSMNSVPSGQKESRWLQLASVTTDIVENSQTTIKWGLEFFPVDGGCGVFWPSVDCAYGTGSDIKLNIAKFRPNGATPTALAISKAVDYLFARPSDESKFILLVTDGQPNCLETLTDREPEKTIAMIEYAASQDIHTFVVGLADDFKSDDALSRMAIAGMEPQIGGKWAHYKIEDKDTLLRTFDTIANGIAQCSIKLTKSYTDSGQLGVVMDGVQVPRDVAHQDGWDLSTDGKSLAFYGTWCDQLKTSAMHIWLTQNCGTV